jgi:unsaturated rhamnogalacturonyl hydrolase
MKNQLSEEEIRGIATKAAGTLLSYPWKVWFWGDSIGLEGLLNATELTGDAQYQGFVYGLFKGWIARERFRSEFDYTAAGVALLTLYERTRDESLLAAAQRHAAYMAGFRKTDSGAAIRYENAAFELPPELPPDHPDFEAWRELAERVKNGGPCIFVDSMHFDAPFYAALYRVTGKDEYRQLAVETALSQVHLLYDPQDGLFHHFWIEQTRQRNGVVWGRGNGWGLLGLVDTLENLPTADTGASEIREVLCRVLGRMAKLQDSCGGWHTVLTDTSSYIETSIAAFMIIVMSRAMLRSWIDPEKYLPVVEKAWVFLLEHIRPDGVLEGVSYETFPSTRVEHYRSMPRGGVVPWGQGPLLSALWAHTRLRHSLELQEKVTGQGSH